MAFSPTAICTPSFSGMAAMAFFIIQLGYPSFYRSLEVDVGIEIDLGLDLKRDEQRNEKKPSREA